MTRLSFNRRMRAYVTKLAVIAVIGGATTSIAVAESVKFDALVTQKEALRLDFADSSKHFGYLSVSAGCAERKTGDRANLHRRSQEFPGDYRNPERIHADGGKSEPQRLVARVNQFHTADDDALERIAAHWPKTCAAGGFLG